MIKMVQWLNIIAIFLYSSFEYVNPTHIDDLHWDLLIYTQRWPITVCRNWEEKGPFHKCDMPRQPDTWKVHGIWPTRLGSIGPAFCNKTWHFDPEEIRPIEANLIENWSNIEIEGSTYSFWAHEWNKHGTCAAPVVEQLNTQIKYFTEGLNLLQQYSMTNVLSSVGIIPSNVYLYPITDIHQAIKNALGVNPVIECRQEDGQDHLFELRICFDKSLNLTKCDGVITHNHEIQTYKNGEKILTNCKASGGIIYPKSLKLQEPEPQLIYVQLYKLVTWLQWLTL